MAFILNEILIIEDDKIKTNRNPSNSQFMKGFVPWNKNKKFPNSNIGGNTKFKKGNIPQTTKFNGCITIRIHSRTGISYKYVRILKGKWQLLHHYNYEKKYGHLQKGWIIRFKDKNTLNCDISNLEAISKAENMVRNLNREKAAQSIKDLWHIEKLRKKYGLKTKSKFKIK